MIALALVAASGFGSGNPAAATSTTLPARLVGIYTTTLTGKEHFHGPGANRLTPGTPSSGKWELTLSPARATLTQPQTSFRVTFKVVHANGRIKFAASRGCDVNLSRLTAGVYTYRVVGSRLRFREVRDSCVDRAATLTEEPWHTR